MRHDLNLRGLAFGLRPVQDSDAPLLLALRGDPTLNRYLNPTSDRLDDQLAWLQAYYERPGDFYFVVERLHDGRAEGVASIYNVDTVQKTAEWGRWILRPGSFAAPESALLI
ncbi:MAG: N-acetyltransferase, partial [Comamonadaceae bacterium]